MKHSIYTKYRETVYFLIAGLLVTGINWCTYAVLTAFCGFGIHSSNIIAWVISVIAAFFLNKIFVFHAKNWAPAVLFREFLLFVSSRVFTGFVEIGAVPLLMAMGLNQSVLGIKGAVAKFIAEFIAMILSFFLSKFSFRASGENEKEKDDVNIEFHADDYGLFLKQSFRILDCAEHGALNGISIMSGTSDFSACMEQLRPKQEELAIAVHLNFMEGKSVCSHEEIPLLTDENDVFCVRFGSLLLHSFLPGRKAYQTQLKREIQAQIYAAFDFLPGNTPLRLDGHAHYHMIPVVFDAMMDVLANEEYIVTYIRFPKEYFRIYWQARKNLPPVRPINLIKVAVLNILAARNRIKYHAALSSLEHRVFMGVLYSGGMTFETVSSVLQPAITLAQKRHEGLEILAHPGGVSESEDLDRLTHPDDKTFLSSPHRLEEAEMLLRVKRDLC